MPTVALYGTDEPIIRTVIPAGPGWNVAIFVRGDDKARKDRFWLDPIIAWEVERCGEWRDCYRCMTPLLFYQDSLEHNQWCVKRPDGKFEFEYGEGFDNEAEALAQARIYHDQEKQREADKAALRKRLKSVNSKASLEEELRILEDIQRREGALVPGAFELELDLKEAIQARRRRERREAAE